MTSSSRYFLSLFDVVQRFNQSNRLIPLCESHQEFLMKIPARLPFLSGFEYHLSSLSRPCDALVCCLLRDLQRLMQLSDFINSDSIHFEQAHRASSLLLNLPRLLCQTDHIWFELDALPSQSLSFFVGNHSSIQSVTERRSILDESKALTHQWISSFNANYLPIFDFNLALDSFLLNSSDWLIAEVGIMDRDSSTSHIKLLLNPTKPASFSEFLDVYVKFFPECLLAVEKLRRATLALVLNDFDCHHQLSIAMYADKVIGAIEVLPTFNSNEVGEYDQFFRSVLSSCLRLLGADEVGDFDCSTYFADLDGGHFSSRLHHLKITPRDNSHWIPKIYRDLRLEA